jgi:hypothetical protein
MCSVSAYLHITDSMYPGFYKRVVCFDRRGQVHSCTDGGYLEISGQAMNFHVVLGA